MEVTEQDIIVSIVNMIRAAEKHRAAEAATKQAWEEYQAAQKAGGDLRDQFNTQLARRAAMQLADDGIDSPEIRALLAQPVVQP